MCYFFYIEYFGSPWQISLILYGNVWPTTRLTSNNVTLLAIITVLLLLALRIASSQMVWSQTLLSRHLEINDWIQSRIQTQIQPSVFHWKTPLTHALPKAGIQGQLGSTPLQDGWEKWVFWVSDGCPKLVLGWGRGLGGGLHNLLPHQTFMGHFFSKPWMLY